MGNDAESVKYFGLRSSSPLFDLLPLTLDPCVLLVFCKRGLQDIVRSLYPNLCFVHGVRSVSCRWSVCFICYRRLRELACRPGSGAESGLDMNLPMVYNSMNQRIEVCFTVCGYFDWLWLNGWL